MAQRLPTSSTLVLTSQAVSCYSSVLDGNGRVGRSHSYNKKITKDYVKYASLGKGSAWKLVSFSEVVKDRSGSKIKCDMGWFINGKCRSNARLDGKAAIITGSNTGIGKATAFHFVKRGAKVILACRDVNKGEKAALEISDQLKTVEHKGCIQVERLDLASLESVRQFSQKIIENEKQIHLLINNAGVMMCPRQLSPDGYELQFATNHLGHFLLTLLLLPTILASAPARIVNVSSLVHYICRSMHFDDINLDKSYSPVAAYSRSKLANVLFTKELARRLQDTGVSVYCLHPGVVHTELARHVDSAFVRGFRFFYEKLGRIFQKSPEQGAQTTLHCAIDEKTGSETGLYYDDCRIKTPSSMALNEEIAKELWVKSLEMVKLPMDFDPFSPRI